VSKANKMGRGRINSATQTPRRLNLRALVILAVVILVPGAGFFAVRAYQDQKGQSSFLAEARRAFDDEKYDYAIKYINRYVEGRPDDLEGLELKGRILEKTLHDYEGLREAIRVQELILARSATSKPDDPKRLGALKRLTILNLRSGNKDIFGHAAEDAARKYLDLVDPQEATKPGDPNVATAAEGHRLLADALVMIGDLGGFRDDIDRATGKVRVDATGNKMTIAPLDEAMREYEKSELLQPGDVGGGIRLAMLYRTKGKDPKKAEELLSRIKEKNQNSVPARLGLFRFFLDQPNGAGQAAALAELDAALKLAPGNAEARLISAEMAIKRGDTKDARNQIAKIDPPLKNDLRLKLIQGMIEFREQRNDEGIASWREGLMQTGGSDAELNWRLARVLLGLGRVQQAQPQLDRYFGLTNGGDYGTPEYRLLAALKQLRLGNVNGRADIVPKGKKETKEEHESRLGAKAMLEEIRDKISREHAVLHMLSLGDAHLAAGENGLAMECYRDASTMFGAGPQPFLSMARLQLVDKPADAIITLNNGLRQSPDPGLMTTLMRVLFNQELAKPTDQRNWKDFEIQLLGAEAVVGNSPELAMVRADYLAATGSLVTALEHVEKAIKDAPTAVGPRIAKVNALAKLGRLDEALAALNEAMKEAGENAQFRITKSRLLTALGEPKAAYEALAQGIDLVPPDQRAALWSALGEFHQGRSDFVSARRAFEEWAHLQPQAAEPRLALLRLAIAIGDSPAMIAQAEEVKKAVGPDHVLTKIARVEALLKVKPREPGDKAPEDKARLDEMVRLVNEIKDQAKTLPAGYLLDGALMERLGKNAEAITAYQTALDHRGGTAALKPLVVLLTREKRYADIDELHRKLGSFPFEIEQLASTLTLEMGDSAQAEHMVQRMIQGDPQSLDAAVWKVKVLKKNGKDREAEETLKILVQKKPEDPNPWMQLMMFQVAAREPAKAKATLEAMKSRVKVDADRAELLWAACYRVLGMKAEADATYEAALARRPDDMRTLQAAAEYYESINRGDLAEKSLRRMLKVRPGYDWPRRRLALILSARPNDPPAWGEAISLVGEASKGPESPDDRLLRATVLSRNPDPKARDEAIAILESLAIELPNLTRLHEVLARGLAAVGRREKALEYAARAATGEGALDAVAFYISLLIQEKNTGEAEKQLVSLEKQVIDPDSLMIIQLRAQLLHAKGDDAGAVAAVRRAFEARKTTPDPLPYCISLFRLLISLNLHDDAVKFGADLAKLGAHGKLALAEYLNKRGKDKEAHDLIEQAAKENPAAAADAARSALLLATESGSTPEWLSQADTLLGLALKGQPDSIDLLQSQAMLRHLQGNFTAELEAYRQLKAKNADNFMNLNNMAWTLSEETNHPVDGLKAIDEAIAKGGRQSHLVDTRGVILLRLGRVDEAIKELETAAASLPTPAILYHLARAYRKANRQTDFEKYRDKARQGGLKFEMLQPSERPEAKEIMGPSPLAAAARP
jgi:tetratricopeptide (TPR) repeat protein